MISIGRKKSLSLDENLTIFEEFAGQEKGPEVLLEQQQEAKLVYRALQSLNGAQKEVIILKYINGLDNDQIATILGKKQAAIRQIQHRALKQLRDWLEKEDHE